MQEIRWIGIDLGKHTFHLHGQDAKGHCLLREKLNRKRLMAHGQFATV